MRPQKAIAIAAFATALFGTPNFASAERVKDLVEIDGFRSNPLVGVGIVVGLGGTGDDASSMATRRPLAAMMKRLGISIAESDLKAKNIALVTVTANLPPFARPGMPIDITVSSMGTSKSLQGGTLLMTPLKGANLKTYAVAQGSLSVGGFLVEGAGGSSKKNHTTVAKIPNGAIVELAAPGKIASGEIVLLLRDPDFTTATRIAESIDAAFGRNTAKVKDATSVAVKVNDGFRGRVPALVAQVEALEATPDQRARVVIDERTGTIVVGANVTLGAAAVAHGGITVEIAEKPIVSQPNLLGKGDTVALPRTQLTVDEDDGKLALIPGAATVADVAAALNALGIKPRDMVSIFQALRAANALRAEIVTL